MVHAEQVRSQPELGGVEVDPDPIQLLAACHHPRRHAGEGWHGGARILHQSISAAWPNVKA
jgi:hypothetical protein